MSRKPLDDKIITYAEAGRQVGKTRETIRRWANDGLIPIIRHPSGVPGILQSDLDRLYGVMKEAARKKTNTVQNATSTSVAT